MPNEKLCFSLVVGSERTIDLQAFSEEQAETWIAALKQVCPKASDSEKDRKGAMMM